MEAIVHYYQRMHFVSCLQLISGARIVGNKYHAINFKQDDLFKIGFLLPLAPPTELKDKTLLDPQEFNSKQTRN